MAVLGPDIEGATDSAIRAHGFGAADAGLAHSRFDFGHPQDGAVSNLRFDFFDDVDHAVQRPLGNPRQEPGLREHGLFHERVARADGDAVAAGDATGLTDGGTAVPEHAGVRILPVDGQRLIDLDVLTTINA